MSAALCLPAACDLASMASAETVRVRSADELRNAMRLSRTRPTTLDASGLDRILRLDGARGLLEVQAATRWDALAAWPALAGHGLVAFARAAGLPASVGQAFSENAAGPDGTPAARHVQAFVLVTPDGDLRRVDRASHRDLFRLVAGGQEVFGMLYSVTLDIGSLRASAAAAQEAAELLLPDEAPAPRGACEIALLLPPERLDRFLGEVRTLAADRRLALQSITVRRTLVEDETRLRWARREWAAVRVRFAVRHSLGAAVNAAQTRRGLLALALEGGGCFPVSDLRDATRAQLEACYPEISAFLAEKRRADPSDRLQNAWYRTARAILCGERCESRWAPPR